MRRLTRHDGLRRAWRAFTLIEILVVVAIVALVAAGLAAIFASVGDTVAAGQRISAVNRYTNLIETIMRRDVERLTRDGFLVIRNEYANAGADVSLYPGDPQDLDGNGTAGRPRRIDELLFFARGDFASIRRAMAPGFTPSGGEALIYYGHGQPDVEDLVDTGRGTYLYPMLWDTNIDIDARLGVPAQSAGVENPNRYASGWILARRQTVLVTPAAGESRVPRDPVFDLDPGNANERRRLRDHPWQIEMQPAATSVFNARLDDYVDPGGFSTGGGGNISLPGTPLPLRRPNFLVREADHAQFFPRFSSGLVDVATESLAQIRSVVTSSGVFPRVAAPDYFTSQGSPAFDPENVATRQIMRAWMLEAMPGEMDRTDPQHPTTVSRLRVEPLPPLLFIPDSLISGSGDRADRVRAYREADQEMLAAHGFIPRCTEFIVEWSFGTTYPQADPQGRGGQVQWFGLDRAAEDTNGDGVINPATDVRVAESFSNASVAISDIMDAATRQRVTQLVMGDFGGFVGAGPLTYDDAVFGYYDPGTNTSDTSDDGVWPWPTMLRFTISFADPNDPSIEATTQFVVDVPGGGLR